jgi:hypothetical protein
MKHQTIAASFTLCLLCLLCLVLFTVRGNSQGDLGAGVGLSPWDTTQQEKKQKQVQVADPFIKALARRFNASEDELTRLWYRGYGRNELIKLLLISREAGKPFRQVARDRERKERLSKIAGKYSIDYASLLDEAARVRNDLDIEVRKSADTYNGVRTSSGIVISSASFQPPVTSTTTQGK